MAMHTNKEIKTKYCGTDITIPQGSSVIFVPGNGGGYALASIKQLRELSNNDHDPKYRYCWLNENDVSKK
jgi:ribosomal protein L24E